MTTLAALLFTTRAFAQDTDLAFQGVQQALEDARQMVITHAPVENTDQADGFRYVLRRIEHWLQSSGMSDFDPAHPRVYRCPSKVCKLGFDSPDLVYLAVGPVDTLHDYRVFGKRGSVDLTTFQMNEGLGGTETLTSDDLIVDATGNREILLSPNPQPGNWLLIPNLFMSIDDQFGANTARVRKLVSICSPVDKNGEGLRDPSQHQCCYRVLDAKLDDPVPVEITDPFGTHQAQVGRCAETLCVPCATTVLP